MLIKQARGWLLFDNWIQPDRETGSASASDKAEGATTGQSACW